MWPAAALRDMLDCVSRRNAVTLDIASRMAIAASILQFSEIFVSKSLRKLYYCKAIL